MSAAVPVSTRVSLASHWQPRHLVQSAWTGHAPFAAAVVEVLRPDTLVELGAHMGFSYFAFCETVARLGIDTRTVAVDSWEGDEHAGYYGDEVYESVRRINEAYASFSTLTRSYFDKALPGFADGSIDLLHIDGRHRFEDVTSEFEAWLPKMSPRGVMLFHDTNEFKEGFGVHRFWADVESRYPSFHFLHSHGLGVLGVGSQLDPRVRDMFAILNDSPDASRAAYESLAGDITHRAKLEALPARVRELDRRARDIGSELSSETRHREEAQERLAQSRRELRAARRALDDVLSSTSWRLTAPVRALGGLVPRRSRR
ncbi:class I SAM-dependent methyltransferase [Labedella populi]|uniref:Class I SAM-dependent methyltransferase n=1 Tax=Labedella populi TaxID=2498850 RepID=A0A444QG56_9MICO|nr:class I SAM-dependent methyltransferase [Labedella populi]RWZ68524.1 class I SAM-dependent methyltransferase [Labedella populi]